MQTMASWARDQTFPSWLVNALGKALSLLAEQVSVIASDATHIRVPSSANDGATILAIGGLWRYMESNVTVAHPGGAAGTYAIYATAKANNIVSTPAAGTDATDYSFGLEIHPVGTTPTIVAGTLDVYRQIATCVWDGAAITQVTQLVPTPPQHASRHAVGGADPVTPASIGAATVASAATVTALAAETARAEAAEAAETARAEAAEPTPGQFAALPGTSGSPGSGNKYVTDSDARNTNARTPTGHAASHAVGGSDPVTPLAIGALARWNYRAVSGAPSAADGDWLFAAGGSAVALPTPTVGRMVAVEPDSTATGAAPVTISTASGHIRGAGLSDSTPVTSFAQGTPHATVVLAADGTDWHIVAGQRDTGWVSVAGGTSGTRRIVGRTAYGTFQVSTSSSSSGASAAGIPHGLGAAPVFTMASAWNSDYSAGIDAFDSTTIQVGIAPGPIGGAIGTYRVSWTASV